MNTVLIAQDPAPQNAPPGGPLSSPFFLFVMMGLFVVTMIIMPQRRQKKELAALMASIKQGTEVQTAAGIIGTITRIKDGDDEIVIRSEDAKLKITRASIVRVIPPKDEAK